MNNNNFACNAWRDFTASRLDGDLIRKPNENEFRLVSQEWLNGSWHHDLVRYIPQTVVDPSLAALVVTGDRAAPDEPWAQALAEASGVCVWTLFDIPNQPIWGLREDDLIAHTMDRYIASGVPSDVLLFPMVKAVLGAMDAIQSLDSRVERFILIGASKRAWTCWLTACLPDERIAGIAPMVFDNLGFERQLEHQRELWGSHSLMFEPYVRERVIERADTPSGHDLMRLTDPLERIDCVQLPVLMINGSNDPYWAVDALTQIWRDLKMPKWVRIFPNVGHGAGEADDSINLLSRFIQKVNVREFTEPEIEIGERSLHVSSKVLTIWLAASLNSNFSEARWVPTSSSMSPRPGEAMFLEFEYAGTTLTTPAIHWPG